MKNRLSTDKQVVDRIYGHGRGSVFTQNDFADLGSSDSVDFSLRLLTKRGVVRRLRQGLYDYPKTHAEIGILSPQSEKVAQALARKGRAAPATRRGLGRNYARVVRASPGAGGFSHRRHGPQGIHRPARD